MLEIETKAPPDDAGVWVWGWRSGCAMGQCLGRLVESRRVRSGWNLDVWVARVLRRRLRLRTQLDTHPTPPSAVTCANLLIPRTVLPATLHIPGPLRLHPTYLPLSQPPWPLRPCTSTSTRTPVCPCAPLWHLPPLAPASNPATFLPIPQPFCSPPAPPCAAAPRCAPLYPGAPRCAPARGAAGGRLWRVPLSGGLTSLLLAEHPSGAVRRAVVAATLGPQADAALQLMDVLRRARDDQAHCLGQPSFAHLRAAGSVAGGCGWGGAEGRLRVRVRGSGGWGVGRGRVRGRGAGVGGAAAAQHIRSLVAGVAGGGAMFHRHGAYAGAKRGWCPATTPSPAMRFSLDVSTSYAMTY